MRDCVGTVGERDLAAVNDILIDHVSRSSIDCVIVDSCENDSDFHSVTELEADDSLVKVFVESGLTDCAVEEGLIVLVDERISESVAVPLLGSLVDDIDADGSSDGVALFDKWLLGDEVFRTEMVVESHNRVTVSELATELDELRDNVRVPRSCVSVSMGNVEDAVRVSVRVPVLVSATVHVSVIVSVRVPENTKLTVSDRD